MDIRNLVVVTVRYSTETRKRITYQWWYPVDIRGVTSSGMSGDWILVNCSGRVWPDPFSKALYTFIRWPSPRRVKCTHLGASNQCRMGWVVAPFFQFPLFNKTQCFRQLFNFFPDYENRRGAFDVANYTKTPRDLLGSTEPLRERFEQPPSASIGNPWYTLRVFGEAQTRLRYRGLQLLSTIAAILKLLTRNSSTLLTFTNLSSIILLLTVL